MSYFINPNIDLGLLKEHQEIDVTFKAKDNVPYISKIIPSCGCTSVKYDDKNHIITAHYKSGQIPFHLGNQMETHKHLTIKYDDDTSEDLHFHGLIQK